MHKDVRGVALEVGDFVVPVMRVEKLLHGGIVHARDMHGVLHEFNAQQLEATKRLATTAHVAQERAALSKYIDDKVKAVGK